MQQHLNCDWLIKKGEYEYFCCDARSSCSGKVLKAEEMNCAECPFFHNRNQKNMVLNKKMNKPVQQVVNF